MRNQQTPTPTLAQLPYTPFSSYGLNLSAVNSPRGNSGVSQLGASVKRQLTHLTPFQTYPFSRQHTTKRIVVRDGKK